MKKFDRQLATLSVLSFVAILVVLSGYQNCAPSQDGGAPIGKGDKTLSGISAEVSNSEGMEETLPVLPEDVQSETVSVVPDGDAESLNGLDFPGGTGSTKFICRATLVAAFRAATGGLACHYNKSKGICSRGIVSKVSRKFMKDSLEEALASCVSLVNIEYKSLCGLQGTSSFTTARVSVYSVSSANGKASLKGKGYSPVRNTSNCQNTPSLNAGLFHDADFSNP